jgi:uncharacterized protein
LSADKNSNDARLAVKVTPNAGRSEITGMKDGVLQMRVGAPPDKGKANKELIDVIAEKLGIKKASVLIVKGQTSRYKTVIIEGLSGEELLKRISS